MAKQIPLKLMVLVLASIVGVGAALSSATGVSSPAQGRDGSGPVRSDTSRFTLEENGRQQNLEVGKRAGGTLDVAISVAGACSRREAGTAKARAGEVEVEVDPDGEGYPTDTFVLTSRDRCRITILLAAPDREYAWIRESGCASTCPLSSKPMARR
jgi:hypothetical protein